MADRDWKLVVRNALACIAAEGFPSPPIISVNLSKILHPYTLFETKTQLFLAYCLYIRAIFTEQQRKQDFALIDSNAEGE